jgi:hypothetical protein
LTIQNSHQDKSTQMPKTYVKILCTVVFLSVVLSSATSETKKPVPSRFNKYTLWTDWANNLRTSILASIGWESYGVNQRNLTHPSQIKFDWKNMAQLGLPEEFEIDEACKTFGKIAFIL